MSADKSIPFGLSLMMDGERIRRRTGFMWNLMVQTMLIVGGLEKGRWRGILLSFTFLFNTFSTMNFVT